MKSLRRGLWDGEVGKDARGRFSCRICHRLLEVRADDGERAVQSDDAGEIARTDEGVSRSDSAAVGRSNGGERVARADGESVERSCPECGRAWESRADARWRTTGG
ncbi:MULTISPECIES: hypothetical protein [Halorussus]|uniref:hypothetical protein n=1 Tax=Halorussus TaxID=1070314 RepID=UPI000E218374|nr:MULTISPECIES: hypothetical protein [Halorussus]NHN58053.1 hypothetical protein [Halorussus sp. JP-T4]